MTRTIALSQYADSRRSPHQRDVWNLLHPLLFGIGLTFALIPSIYTFNDYEFVLLPLMALFIFITHLALTMHTLSVAASTRAWGEGKEAWHVFAVTGVSAQQTVWGIWRTIMRRVWFDHVAFSLLRLGLAVGMAQMLHLIERHELNSRGLDLLYYASLCGGGSPMSPDVLQVIIGGLVLISFAFLEAGLLAAFGTMLAIRLQNHSSALRFGVNLTLRAFLVLSVIATWGTLQSRSNFFWSEAYCAQGSHCSLQPRRDAEERLAQSKWRSNFIQLNATIASATAPVSFGVSMLGDNGVIVVADMMRPSFGIFTIFRSFPYLLIGATLYWILIRLAMRAAVRSAVQKGMLP